MILTHTMSSPALSIELWLRILRQLRYLDLKVTQLYNRSFRELYRHPTLDGVTYREGPDPAKIRKALGLDGLDDRMHYFGFRLHLLLDADEACRQFPTAAWFFSTSFERVPILSGKPPALLRANPAQREMATVPAVTDLVVSLSWDSVEPEPIDVCNVTGVTVGDVVRALGELCEDSLAQDDDDSVARSLDALASGNGDVEWETNLGLNPDGNLKLSVEMADMPWSWPAARLDQYREDNGIQPDPEFAARFTEILMATMGGGLGRRL